MTGWTPKNARGSKVMNLDTRQEIKQVAWIDTQHKVLSQFVFPIRLDEEGGPMEKHSHIDGCFPVYAGQMCPTLLLVYGVRSAEQGGAA